MADTFKTGDHVKVVNVNPTNTFLGITGTIVSQDGDAFRIKPDPAQHITNTFLAAARVLELLASPTSSPATAASSAVYDFKDIARRIGRRA